MSWSQLAPTNILQHLSKRGVHRKKSFYINLINYIQLFKIKINFFLHEDKRDNPQTTLIKQTIPKK